MMRKTIMSKRILALIIACAMLLAFSACGKEEAPAPVSITEDTATCYVCNNIEVEDVYDSRDGFEGSYIQISGLKDTEVQDKINAEIKALYDKLAADDFEPGFEGYKEPYNSFEGEKTKYVNAFVNSNVNNILSVEVAYSLSNYLFIEDYSNLPDGYTDVGVKVSYPLNFDLNTGNQITMADLFLDGFDYKNYIDDKIKAEIEYTNNNEDAYSLLDFPLIGEYGGIRDDQPFSLCDSGSHICIYFNEKDPFYNYVDDWGDGTIYFSDKLVYLTLQGVSAVADRFYNEKNNIYTTEEKNYNLRVNDYDPVGSTWYWKDYGDDDIMFGYGHPMYTDMPESLKNALDEKEAKAPEIFEEIKSKAKNLGLKPGEYSCYPDYSSSFDSYGPYTVLTTNLGYEIYDGESFEALDAKYDNTVELFRTGDPTPLTIEDLFKKGVDYRAALVEAFKKYNQVAEFGSIPDDVLEPYANECIDNIKAVAVYVDSLWLYYDNLEAITAKYNDNPDNYWTYQYVVEYIPYDCLNAEDLTIFE